MFSDRSLIIAAVSDPHFKLTWLKEKQKKEEAEKFFREEYRRVADICTENLAVEENSQDGSTVSDTGSTPTKRLKKDFFDSFAENYTVDNDEIEKYLKEKPGPVKQLQSYPNIAQIFKLVQFIIALR